VRMTVSARARFPLKIVAPALRAAGGSEVIETRAKKRFRKSFRSRN